MTPETGGQGGVTYLNPYVSQVAHLLADMGDSETLRRYAAAGAGVDLVPMAELMAIAYDTDREEQYAAEEAVAGSAVIVLGAPGEAELTRSERDGALLTIANHLYAFFLRHEISDARRRELMAPWLSVIPTRVEAELAAIGADGEDEARA